MSSSSGMVSIPMPLPHIVFGETGRKTVEIVVTNVVARRTPEQRRLRRQRLCQVVGDPQWWPRHVLGFSLDSSWTIFSVYMLVERVKYRRNFRWNTTSIYEHLSVSLSVCQSHIYINLKSTLSISHICTQFCLYLTNIWPIYHLNQGHISVILIWEKYENQDLPPPWTF